MSIPSPIRRLFFLNHLTGFSVRHILSVAITVGSGLTVGAVKGCSVLLSLLGRVVLFIVVSLLFFGFWVRCIVFGRPRLPQRATGKFISHEIQFQQR